MTNTVIKSFIALAAIVWVTAAPLRVAAGTIEHHALDINLLPDQSQLTATATLQYLPQGERQAFFFLAPQVEIKRVEINDQAAQFSFQDRRLSIRLGKWREADTVEITVSYAGRFDDQPPRGAPVNNEDPTYGVAATIRPDGTFLGGGAGWYPAQPDSRSRFHVRVTAPEGTIAVTSGQLVEQKTRNKKSVTVWETSYTLPSLSIAAGEFIVDEKKAGDVPIYTFFYPQSRQLAQTYLDAAANYLELYQDLFGPYPFDKFAVVENFFPTGYGFPSWTLLGSTIVHLPFIVETSLGHEIAHSWWGTGVRVDYRHGNWSEGLTTYVADYLYKERSSEEEAQQYRLKTLRDYSALVSESNELALKDFTRRDSRPTQAVGYGKAAMVFHMARQKVGDEAFWQALREIADKSMFKKIGWSDFAREMERLSGVEMTAFFDQWVKRPGVPSLHLEQVEVDSADSTTRISARLSQDKPHYDLDVEIRLETDSGPVHKSLRLQGSEKKFSFEIDGEPQRLIVDPDSHLFRKLAPEEIPPIVNSVRGARDLTVVIARDLHDDIAQAARVLLKAMNRPDARLMSEDEFASSPLDQRKGTVLFLGLPEAFSSPLHDHPQIEVDENGFNLHDRRYNGKETALFAALAPDRESNRTWAYFIPYSVQAAQTAARKIPHYGKYSYLAFDGGQNQDKGTWDIRHSPLIHDFNNNEVRK